MSNAINNLISAYASFCTRVSDERDHLIEKLIEVKALTYNEENNQYSLKKYNINTEQYEYTVYSGKPSFTTLLEAIDPITIQSTYHGLATSVKPILKGSLYHSSTEDFIYPYTNKISLEKLNLFLINKTNLYREYLSYQLKDMGIGEDTVNTAVTLHDKIDLISEIERIQDVTIDLFIPEEEIGQDVLIYKDILNILDLTFKDERGRDVEQGSVKVFNYFDGYDQTDLSKNNNYIFYDDVVKDITVTPHELGETKYIIYYINKDKTATTIYPQYRESIKVITVKTVLSDLIPYISMKNDTLSSKFYMEDYDSTYAEGYKTDVWDINIQIKKQSSNDTVEDVNFAVPFNLYLNDKNHLIYSGTTNNAGYANINDLNIPYFSSDFIDFRENAVTSFTIQENKLADDTPQVENATEIIMNSPLTNPWSITLLDDCKIYIGTKYDYIMFDNSNGNMKGYTTNMYYTLTDTNDKILSNEYQLLSDDEKPDILHDETGDPIKKYQIDLIYENTFTPDTIITYGPKTFIEDEKEYTRDVLTIVNNSNLLDIFVEDINTSLNPTMVWKIDGEASIDDIDFNVSFITDPIFKQNKIQYKRVYCTSDTYLDELNECITDISIDNNNISYTTFSTDQHIKLSDLTNFNTLYSLVTEILYTMNDQNVVDYFDYETLSTQEYYQYDEKQRGQENIPLILETDLQGALLNQYTNVQNTMFLNIYHSPISITTPLIWYKNDNSAPTYITFELHDEETGDSKNNSLDSYTIEVNDVEDSIANSTYQYPMNIKALSYSGQNISYKLKKENKTIYESSEHITILSSFELPEKTIYYLSNTPDIYYKPKGIAAANKHIKVNNANKNTDANGLISDIKTIQTIGTHSLTLIASSDNLSEEVTFSYELKKPFTIERANYNQTSQIVYAITFYDKEHVGWMHTQGASFIPDPKNFINVMNQNNENIDYTYTNSFTDESIAYYITVDKTTDTVGVNTLTVEVNEYSETDTFEFKLYEHLYELVTTEIGLGYQQDIQIKCNDPDVNTVEISGTGISRKTLSPITKTDDILTVRCSITQAAPNGITISMSHNDITEVGTLIIPKGNVGNDLYIGSSRVTSFPIGQSTNLYLYASISFPINTSQTFIVNDGINNSTYNINNSSGITEHVINFKNTNRAPGIYTATLTYNGDSNFNPCTNSLTYTITAENCTIVLSATNNFIDDTNTSSTLTAQYKYNETPIPSATLTLTLNGNVVSTSTTNSNGQVSFTITEPGEYTVVAKSNDETMCASNTITINSIVEESDTHIPDNIVLESNKNILSSADNETTTLTATIYDQHGDKIKNKIINFYIITEDEYISDINLVDGELVLTTIKANSVNNTELVTDVTLTNGELVVTKSIFANKNSQNIENVLENINFE